MKLFGVGWLLILILAVLQYNFKKERLHTLALQKNRMYFDKYWENTQLLFDQESGTIQSSPDRASIRSRLKSIEKSHQSRNFE